MEVKASNQFSADNRISRRKALGTGLGLAGGLLAVLSSSNVQGGERPSVAVTSSYSWNHEIKPLSFNPSKLKGLSQQLIESHWKNNYAGSVRALNETNRRLMDAATDKEFPAYLYNNLKREHLMRSGSVILHELYFDTFGGSGAPSASIRTLIGAAFGSYDRWETEFRKIAAGLSGGSGWVMLGYNREFRTLENYWMPDHMHSPVSTVPLLVLDMYEHSYHMDFGTAAARYVDAYFQNLNWEVVSARYEELSGGAA